MPESSASEAAPMRAMPACDAADPKARKELNAPESGSAGIEVTAPATFAIQRLISPRAFSVGDLRSVRPVATACAYSRIAVRRVLSIVLSAAREFADCARTPAA